MSNQPNQDKSNRAKARRRKREAARVPGAGAGKPIPIRSAEGQPAAISLADLAKTGGGQVPLSIPQLMAQVGTLKVERDFWMNAAVALEGQLNAMVDGTGIPSIEDVAAAEGEEEIQDISNTVEACPGCGVAIGPEDEFIDAVHSEDCTFDEPTQIGTNVPAGSLPPSLTEEEQAVVDEANEKIRLERALPEGSTLVRPEEEEGASEEQTPE